jgi:hypothetical protein
MTIEWSLGCLEITENKELRTRLNMCIVPEWYKLDDISWITQIPIYAQIFGTIRLYKTIYSDCHHIIDYTFHIKRFQRKWRKNKQKWNNFNWIKNRQIN